MKKHIKIIFGLAIISSSISYAQDTTTLKDTHSAIKTQTNTIENRIANVQDSTATPKINKIDQYKLKIERAEKKKARLTKVLNKLKSKTELNPKKIANIKDKLNRTNRKLTKLKSYLKTAQLAK